MRKAVFNVYQIKAERCRRSLYYFVKEFWSEISGEDFVPNWHIELFCNELMEVAKRVSKKQPKEYDLIINVPPGTTKTVVFSIMFPVWCWLKWYWMKFITASYSSALSLESAEYSRDLVRSEKFRQLFPYITIKQDKDTKSNFRVQKMFPDGTVKLGGNRYSTSVGGTLTGFHCHIGIVDDPLDPNRSVSDVELKKGNRWVDQTLSTRKVDKAVSATLMIMQRLHQNDPSGHILSKKKSNVRHICLPGEIRNYKEQLNPPELAIYYKDDLLDPIRMPWKVMKDLEADMGQYGYAGQIGQNPTPPGGGMFKVDHFQMLPKMPSEVNIVQTVRAWDKAGSEGGDGAYTVGVKMSRLASGKFLVSDVKRGRWSSEEREAIIRETAEADGQRVVVWHEQEPGSGGKDSAAATTRNLAGYSARSERPTGDKTFRADPYSVQVNNGNVLLLVAEWNKEYIEEFRFFPFSTHKDQVDASSLAFNHIAAKKIAGRIGRR